MTGDGLKYVKRFLTLATVLITLVIVTVFIGFHMRTEKLIEDVLLQQARALFDEVIMTRRWVTEHGGVFVKVSEGSNPNPYLLKLPGLKVNIKDEEGTRYTLRNPGLVTREISELADRSGLFYFHISSLDPVNKETNSPDDFERVSLKSFEKGQKESFSIEETKDGPIYRYMAPLYYEKSCDGCHGSQGYKIGDIRGGISISIPMSPVNQRLAANRRYTVASAILILGLLFAVLFLLAIRFLRALKDAQGKLVHMALTDGLTNLANRKSGIDRLKEEISRHGRSKRPLSCLMLDIDHFKQVNDTYGHLAGDAVLVSISDLLRKHIRAHDTICRYGGEEFMILLPETATKHAVAAAEKIRGKVMEEEITFKENPIKITVSIGVAQMDPKREETPDSIIYRADEALYRAKVQGRNRLCCAETDESAVSTVLEEESDQKSIALN